MFKLIIITILNIITLGNLYIKFNLYNSTGFSYKNLPYKNIHELIFFYLIIASIIFSTLFIFILRDTLSQLIFTFSSIEAAKLLEHKDLIVLINRATWDWINETLYVVGVYAFDPILRLLVTGLVCYCFKHIDPLYGALAAVAHNILVAFPFMYWCNFRFPMQSSAKLQQTYFALAARESSLKAEIIEIQDFINSLKFFLDFINLILEPSSSNIDFVSCGMIINFL